MHCAVTFDLIDQGNYLGFYDVDLKTALSDALQHCKYQSWGVIAFKI